MSATAAPIGTVVSSSAVTSWNVTSTAASVGPYRLCSAAPEMSRNRAAVCGGSASPDAKTFRSVATSSALGCVGSPAAPLASDATNTDNIEGTKCATVTPRSAMIRARYAGSRCPSGAATTRRAPTCNGQKNSHTDTSKVNGVFCSTTSASVMGYMCWRQRRLATIAPCPTATPLGRPVEPDVKMTYARFSADSGADRSASVTGVSEWACRSRASTATIGVSVSRVSSSRVVVRITTGRAMSRT